MTPPAKRLRAFDKIELAPGATKNLTFNISQEDLSYVGVENKWVFEAGEFVFECGGLNKKITL